jgi:hypothetical protein
MAHGLILLETLRLCQTIFDDDWRGFLDRWHDILE